MNIEIKGIKMDRDFDGCVFCNEKGCNSTKILDKIICDRCNEKISNLEVDNINYNFYKNIIRDKIISKIKF